jgi:hypothetical protein
VIEGNVVRLKEATLSLEQIRQLRNDWSHEEAARWSAKVEDCGTAQFAAMPNAAIWIGDQRDYLITLRRRSGQRQHYSFTLPTDVVETLGGPDALSTFPKTLREFQQWWDSLSNDIYMVKPYVFAQEKTRSEPDFMFPSDYDSAQITLDFHRPIAPPAKIYIVHIPERGMGCNSFYFKNEHGILLRPAIEIPIEDGADIVQVPVIACSVLRFNRRMLVKRFNTWGASDYDAAFGPLKAESVGLGDVSLDEAASGLRSRLDKLDHEVEIGGLKFQFADLPFWGVLVVLTLQLYLALNIKELWVVLRKEAPIRVSWLVVSASLPALCFSLLALCVLPVGSVILAVKVNPAVAGWFWVASFTSLLIGAWTFGLIILVRRSHRNPA